MHNKHMHNYKDGFKIYLFERQCNRVRGKKTETQREREKCLPFASLLFKWILQSRLCQTEVKRQDPLTSSAFQDT